MTAYTHIKGVLLSRALDDRALVTLGNVVSTDIIGEACAHRRAWPIALSIILKNGLNKPRGQRTVCVLITRDLYVLAVRQLEV